MSKNIKNEIMSQIKSGKITMRSRWIFLAQKIGFRSGMALTILILIFSVNAFLFFIKSNNIIIPDYNKFSIWQNIIYNLPYDLIAIIIILLVILNYVVKKFDFSFKLPFIIIFSTFIAFIIFWSSLLFSTGFNHTLQRSLQNLEKQYIKIPYITNFYVHRCGHCDFRAKSSEDIEKMLEECPLRSENK